MKLNIFFLIFFVRISTFCFSQSLSPQSIGTKGGFFSTTGVSLSYTMGQSTNATLANGISLLTQGFQQPEVDINTGVVSSAISCTGVPIVIPYLATGILDNENIFTAQLSSYNGSFANPVNIGSITSSSSGTISSVIPANIPNGSGYRIRVISSRPNFNGRDNGSNILINSLTATCSNNNSSLYFGYSGDQTATIKAIATGGVAPYTVSITMNRPLNCNIITSSGDELWTGIGGTSINNICPVTGSGLTPVSTGIVTFSGGFYSVNVTLMQDAVFTATITDANGCIKTSTTSVHAEDVRCFAGNSSNAKITLCHKTSNSNCVKICVNESAVAAHLDHGDYLGNCSQKCVSPQYAIGVNIEDKFITNDLFNVKVNPNPTTYSFTLNVETGNKEKIVVLVYDVSGRIIEHIEKGNGNLIQFGENLKAGVYLAEIVQGNNRKAIKLVKQ
jgi:hypothetical protein